MSKPKFTKRLRVFAGPNGSGKSTIINAIRNYEIEGYPIDFGIYINADDIAKSLREGSFRFKEYGLNKVSRTEFIEIALQSGLINKNFNEARFRESFSLNNQSAFLLKSKSADEHIAQIMADFLRKRLLQEEKKLSFETVFSHPSKVDFMQQAKNAGYKVYLYFISTESPEINISRIKEIRVKQGGHNVPEDKIEQRYYRSMELLFAASEFAYQAFFFDNSESFIKSRFKLEHFAHFKLTSSGEKVWDAMQEDKIPFWFQKYYLDKQT